MVTQNNNPFVLPGFGQSGDMAQNPITASMEMMRQAWQGLASSGGLNQAAITTPMSVEDLERRISDLRAVENWLRMNLSMLSSTIQGLEVQCSTITTLKSFMNSAAAAGTTPDGPSPLEVVLGMVPGQASGKPAASPAAAQGAGATENTAAASEAYAANAAAAAQGWWDMVQKQFDGLAVATAASLQQGAEAAQAAVQTGGGGVSADSTLGKAPAKAPRKAAAKTPAKAAAKTAAPAKAAAKKPAAKKAAPRKRAAVSRQKP